MRRIVSWLLSYEHVPARVAQRLLDILGSIVVLTVTAPLMLVIAILIKLDSPGPVLFKHVRTGVNRRRNHQAPPRGLERRQQSLFGQQFVLYKFRTMYSDARDRFPALYTYDYSEEELSSLPIKVLVGPKQDPKNGHGAVQLNSTVIDSTVIDDPRVTRVGRWLRKTSLDELPNFINVLKGDMHLVGPRPDIHENISYYPERHRAKLDVKPGVTGLAQINGRGRLSFLETNDHDLEYVNTRSLHLDIKIILKTIGVTLKGDGAF
jgi:lipopolysaccharide/colanic/teichoic acid biosynthesis glycosyltransferase